MHIMRLILIAPLLIVPVIGFIVRTAIEILRTLLLRSAPVHIVHIPDGDGFNIAYNGIVERIRIRRIDAPEYHQAYGKEARRALVALLEFRPVRIVRFGKCPYGRTLATVFVGNRRVDTAMVASGNAWPYRCNWLGPFQWYAMLHRKGIWHAGQNHPEKPWEWRHRHPVGGSRREA